MNILPEVQSLHIKSKKSMIIITFKSIRSIYRRVPNLCYFCCLKNALFISRSNINDIHICQSQFRKCPMIPLIQNEVHERGKNQETEVILFYMYVLTPAYQKKHVSFNMYHFSIMSSLFITRKQHFYLKCQINVSSIVSVHKFIAVDKILIKN